MSSVSSCHHTEIPGQYVPEFITESEKEVIESVSEADRGYMSPQEFIDETTKNYHQYNSRFNEDCNQILSKILKYLSENPTGVFRLVRKSCDSTKFSKNIMFPVHLSEKICNVLMLLKVNLLEYPVAVEILNIPGCNAIASFTVKQEFLNDLDQLQKLSEE